MNTEEIFTQHRSTLFGIAYRMTGTVMDAEDIVQESYVRWQRRLGAVATTDAAANDATSSPDCSIASVNSIENPRAFLSTITTRLCLDHMKSAQQQRERYIGPWLPTPLLTTDRREESPEDLMMQTESLSIAFLVVLESLSPIERAVFLLREVFDFEYSDVAEMVDKTEANCRQILRRARQHVRSQRPRFRTSPNEQAQMTASFVQACLSGDMDSLMSLLHEDITFCSDGGGKVIAAQKLLHGRELVVKFILNIMKQVPEGTEIRMMSLNGAPSIVGFVDGVANTVMTLDVVDGEIWAVFSVRNPEKLQHLRYDE
ncbi:MAG: RNA polymerase sigma factor SigJ [Chloroflexota bacterium]